MCCLELDGIVVGFYLFKRLVFHPMLQRVGGGGWHNNPHLDCLGLNTTGGENSFVFSEADSASAMIRRSL